MIDNILIPVAPTQSPVSEGAKLANTSADAERRSVAGGDDFSSAMKEARKRIEKNEADRTEKEDETVGEKLSQADEPTVDATELNSKSNTQDPEKNSEAFMADSAIVQQSGTELPQWLADTLALLQQATPEDKQGTGINLLQEADSSASKLAQILQTGVNELKTAQSGLSEAQLAEKYKVNPDKITGMTADLAPATDLGRLEDNQFLNSALQRDALQLSSGKFLAAVTDKLMEFQAGTENLASNSADRLSSLSTYITGGNGLPLHTDALAGIDSPAVPVYTRSMMGSESWQKEFNQHMLNMTLRGDKLVSLHLNPRELGPVQVDIKVMENQAIINFQAHAQTVRSAVENAIPELREMLEQQGITLGDTNVSEQNENNEFSFTHSGESQRARPDSSQQDLEHIEIQGIEGMVAHSELMNGRISLYI